LVEDIEVILGIQKLVFLRYVLNLVENAEISSGNRFLGEKIQIQPSEPSFDIKKGHARPVSFFYAPTRGKSSTTFPYWFF
jgi:hypothetical protein